MAPADVALGLVRLLGLRLPLLQLQFVQAGAQNLPRLRPVAVLGAIVLALDDDTGRLVGQADGAVGLVDMLAAGAGSPVGIDPDLRLVDLDLDIVVDDRIDPGRGEAGVAAGARIVGRNADETVNAALRLQPAIGVFAVDAQGRRLDTRLFAQAFFKPFDLVVVCFGPPGVHADQHLRPVLALGASGAGMDFEETVIAVGLARKEAFQLPLGSYRPKCGKRFFRLVQRFGVRLLFRKGDQFHRVIELLLNRLEFSEALFCRRPLAHDRLSPIGVVP